VNTGKRGTVLGHGGSGTLAGKEELESIASLRGWGVFLFTCVREIFLSSLGGTSVLG